MMTAYGTIQSAVAAMKAGAADYLLKPFPPEELLIAPARPPRPTGGAVSGGDQPDQCSGSATSSTSARRWPGSRPHCHRGPERRHRPDPGRDGHGEGVGGTCHPPAQRPAEPAPDHGCLRGHPGDPPGDRAVRPREGRLHRAPSASGRGASSWRTAAACSWTRWPILGRRSRPSFSGSLQEKEFERVGGTQTIKVDVRLISATRKRLEDEVLAGRMREDLFYRLKVITIRSARPAGPEGRHPSAGGAFPGEVPSAAPEGSPRAKPGGMPLPPDVPLARQCPGTGGDDPAGSNTDQARDPHVRRRLPR